MFVWNKYQRQSIIMESQAATTDLATMCKPNSQK